MTRFADIAQRAFTTLASNTRVDRPPPILTADQADRMGIACVRLDGFDKEGHFLTVVDPDLRVFRITFTAQLRQRLMHFVRDNKVNVMDPEDRKRVCLDARAFRNPVYGAAAFRWEPRLRPK